MGLTEAQYRRIEGCLPRQQGNVSHRNLEVLDAILFAFEQGCKWRGLPRRFGNWHTIYTRMSRWSRAGVIERRMEHQDPSGGRGCPVRGDFRPLARAGAAR